MELGDRENCAVELLVRLYAKDARMVRRITELALTGKSLTFHATEITTKDLSWALARHWASVSFASVYASGSGSSSSSAADDQSRTQG